MSTRDTIYWTTAIREGFNSFLLEWIEGNRWLYNCLSNPPQFIVINKYNIIHINLNLLSLHYRQTLVITYENKFIDKFLEALIRPIKHWLSINGYNSAIFSLYIHSGKANHLMSRKYSS